MLPKSLKDALALMENEPIFKRELGPTFVDYYVRFKQTEIARYEKFVAENNIDPASDETTAWEQDEYFDFF
jgi:glutamine synthetase